MNQSCEDRATCVVVVAATEPSFSTSNQRKLEKVDCSQSMEKAVQVITTNTIRLPQVLRLALNTCLCSVFPHEHPAIKTHEEKNTFFLSFSLHAAGEFVF